MYSLNRGATHKTLNNTFFLVTVSSLAMLKLDCVVPKVRHSWSDASKASQKWLLISTSQGYSMAIEIMKSILLPLHSMSGSVQRVVLLRYSALGILTLVWNLHDRTSWLQTIIQYSIPAFIACWFEMSPQDSTLTATQCVDCVIYTSVLLEYWWQYPNV